jgi:lysozyme
MTEPKKPAARAAGRLGVPAAILAAAMVAAHYAAPTTMKREGAPSDGHGNAVAYVDRLGKGKPITICFGQTGFVRTPDGRLVKVALGMKFPISHCRVLLEESELNWAIQVWRVRPEIAAYPHTWAAAIDFVHNFNIRVYAVSSIDREFKAGRWLAGCDRFLPYNKGTVHGRKVVLPGLVGRRKENRRICRIDHISPAQAAAEEKEQ